MEKVPLFQEFKKLLWNQFILIDTKKWDSNDAKKYPVRQFDIKSIQQSVSPANKRPELFMILIKYVTRLVRTAIHYEH